MFYPMWKDELHSLIASFPHPGWGLPHSLRVYRMALWLSAERGTSVDQDTLLAAAYVHDLGALGCYRDPVVDHAVRSVQLLDTVLPADFPQKSRPLLERVILDHTYRQLPRGPEKVLVFHDADILDLMGWIGVTRLLAVAGTETWWVPDTAADIVLYWRVSPGGDAHLSRWALR